MSSINPKINVKKKRPRSLDEYIDGIDSGDRYVLSEAITLVESITSTELQIAHLLLSYAYTKPSKSRRIAITGAPGVGKSTMIEAIGKHYIRLGHRVAVLAVDPSSGISRGSILGDKTRMEYLSAQENAFIRPTAAGKTLGGIARHTKEAIILCEAAGYDRIIVETVGVGQSETVVAGMVDIVMLLLQPGSGDAVQGIKRGIMELSDLFVINKADPDRQRLTEETLRAYSSAIPLLIRNHSHWRAPVMAASALLETGIDDLLAMISKFYDQSPTSYIATRRLKQDSQWYVDQVQRSVLDRLLKRQEVIRFTKQKLQDIDNHKTDPFTAVYSTLNHIFR